MKTSDHAVVNLVEAYESLTMLLIGSTATVVIDIANVHVGLWSSSQQRFFVSVGGARLKCVGRLILKIFFFKKCTNKPVKRFQMKSNGCRYVQHTGLQSTQTRRNTGKQGA